MVQRRSLLHRPRKSVSKTSVNLIHAMRKARALSLLLIPLLLALFAAAPAYATKPTSIQISGSFWSHPTFTPFSPCPSGYSCSTIAATNGYTGSLTSTSAQGAWFSLTAPSGQQYWIGTVTFTGTLTLLGGTVLTGTLAWAEVGYGGGSPWSGTEYWTIIGGTGQLAGIHGYGTNLFPANGPPAYSGTLYLG